MTPSSLQLDHYAFTHIHLEVVNCEDVAISNGYPDFSHAKFVSDVEFEKIDKNLTTFAGDAERYTVGLTLTAEPRDDKAPKFPVKFKVSVLGVFNAPNLEESDRDVRVLVNGASLLYGAVREFILTTTSRLPTPQVLIPTVQFTELASDFEAQLRTASKDDDAAHEMEKE